MTKKQSLLTPLMRWFMFAMVLANVAGSMFPMLMAVYLNEDLGRATRAFPRIGGRGAEWLRFRRST